MRKVAIVTGAATGIGRAVAQRLAKDNMRLVLVDINEKELVNTLEMVKPVTDAIMIKADISDEEQVKNYIKTAIDTYGKLDVMAHVAAIIHESKKIVDTDVETFDKITCVNMRGTFLALKYSIEVMEKQGSGVIICCGSTNSLYGCATLGVYAGSKHGVLGLVKSAAGECGRNGIRVSLVIPGCTNTIMMAPHKEYAPQISGPMGRLAEPEEIAPCFSFLASDEATYTNGSIMYANGGLNLCT